MNFVIRCIVVVISQFLNQTNEFFNNFQFCMFQCFFQSSQFNQNTNEFFFSHSNIRFQLISSVIEIFSRCINAKTITTNTFSAFRMIFYHDAKTKKQKTIYANHENKIIVFDDVVVQTKTIAKFVKKYNDVIRYEKFS